MPLYNIYVPNNQSSILNTDDESLVVEADWNIALQSTDTRGGASWKSTNARDKRFTMAAAHYPLTMMNEILTIRYQD